MDQATSHNIGEVHKFSAWRGLGSMILAGLMIFAVVIIPAIALVVAMAASG